MNPLVNFQIWWKDDPKAKQKLFFIIGVSLFLIILVSFLWWFNFGGSNSQNPNPQNLSYTFNKVSLVDLKSFEDTTKLEVLTKGDSAFTSIFRETNGKIYTFSNDYKLQENGQTVSNSPVLLPISVYLANNSDLIINTLDGVVIYQNGQFKKLSPSIKYLYPKNQNLNNQNQTGNSNQTYLFLAGGENTYSLREATNLDLNQNLKSFGNFQLDSEPKMLEIKKVGEDFYIFTYNNFQRQGNIQIFKLNQTTSNNSITKLTLLQDIQSIQFGFNQILYTKTGSRAGSSIYDNIIWDLTTEAQILTNLQLQLNQQNIQGNLWANRCVFTNLNEIQCLVKEGKTFINSLHEADAVVKYNFQTQELSFPLQGIKISGKNLIFQNNQLYLVGQKNNILYKIK